MRSSRRRRGWSLCGVRKKRRRRRTIELWSRARSVNRAGRDPQLADYIAASSRRYCRRRRRACRLNDCLLYTAHHRPTEWPSHSVKLPCRRIPAVKRNHLCSFRIITPPRGRPMGMQYCVEHVCLCACMCVCVSVWEHISGTTSRPIFTKIFEHRIYLRT